MTMEGRQVNNSVRMLRLPDVLRKTGLSRSQIYRLIAQGVFPSQIQLGERACAWIEAEIDQWLWVRINHARIPSA
jgi:prophage regulatory protein